MTSRTRNLTEQYLRDFTVREDCLLAQVQARGLELPVRLSQWRFWIGDSQIYLNELRNFVELTPSHSVPTQTRFGTAFAEKLGDFGAEK